MTEPSVARKTVHTPVIRGAGAVLAHCPEMARYGSKPARVLESQPELLDHFLSSLRSFDDAVAYAPHQAYIGALHPRSLPPRPWVGASLPDASRFSKIGEIMPQHEFLGLLALVDDFELVKLSEEAASAALTALENHPVIGAMPLDRIKSAATDSATLSAQDGALLLHNKSGRVVGRVRSAHSEDEALGASVIFENLATKATGLLSVLNLLSRSDIDPESVEYVLGCSEEAVGDRYQRGGGNLAKAVAAAAGLGNASGSDIKNFCSAPVPALVVGASLVASGVFNRVMIIAGGSLPKLGMKFQGHLKHGLPVLEDVVGGSATLIERDDGKSPVIRVDAVGRHRVKDGSSNPQIMKSLTIDPLDRLGLKMSDVDDYATELHNPEITEPQGSGNVPERNYKTIAALAAQRGEISREEIPAFMEKHGMPGFAPTQGHLASALCYLPHALDDLISGRSNRVQMLAKGSLFLGRMTDQSDGMSVLLEGRGRS